jgi:hypothetical protein
MLKLYHTQQHHVILPAHLASCNRQRTAQLKHAHRGHDATAAIRNELHATPHVPYSTAFSSPRQYTMGHRHTLYTIHGNSCNKHHRTAEPCHTQRHHVYTAACKRFSVRHVKCAMHLSTSGFFISNGPHTLRSVRPAASIVGAPSVRSFKKQRRVAGFKTSIGVQSVGQDAWALLTMSVAAEVREAMCAQLTIPLHQLVSWGHGELAHSWPLHTPKSAAVKLRISSLKLTLRWQGEGEGRNVTDEWASSVPALRTGTPTGYISPFRQTRPHALPSVIPPTPSLPPQHPLPLNLKASVFPPSYVVLTFLVTRHSNPISRLT